MLLKNPKNTLLLAALLTAAFTVLISNTGLLGRLTVEVIQSFGSEAVTFVLLPVIAILVSLPGALLMTRAAIPSSLLISVVAALEAYWLAHLMGRVLITHYDLWLAVYATLIILCYGASSLFFAKVRMSMTAKACLAGAIVAITAIVADRVVTLL